MDIFSFFFKYPITIINNLFLFTQQKENRNKQAFTSLFLFRVGRIEISTKRLLKIFTLFFQICFIKYNSEETKTRILIFFVMYGVKVAGPQSAETVSIHPISEYLCRFSVQMWNVRTSLIKTIKKGNQCNVVPTVPDINRLL